MDILQEAKDTQQYWAPRTRKIKQWYRFIRLVDELKSRTTSGYETTVSSTPRAFRMQSLHLLSTGKIRDRIPIGTQDLTERDKISDCERALHSFWREKDEEQVNAGQMPWRRQFHDLGFMTGWYATFHGLFRNKDGSPYPRADIWNPANVFQRWVNNKLVGCYYIYPLTQQDLAEEIKAKGWKLKSTQQWERQRNATIYNCWKMDGDDVIHAVYVNDHPVKPPEKEGDFDRIPILTAPVGGFADRGSIPGDKEYIARMGESALEPIRDVVLRKNKLRTFAQQIVKDIAKATHYDVTHDGSGVLSPETIGGIVHLKVGESAGQITPDAAALPFLNALLGQDSAEEQLNSLTSFAYGTTQGLEVSGYLYNQALMAAYASLGELNAAHNQVRGMIDKAWLDTFKKKWPEDYKLTISGKEPSVHTGFFHKEFGPGDIPDFTFVEVEAPLAVPSDLLQRITMMRTAIPQGDLIDLITALDELGQFQDPELIRRRIKEGNMMNSVAMEQVSLIWELKKMAIYQRNQGNNDYADFIDYTVQQLTLQIGYQAGGPTPPAAPGVGPEVLPPEMRGVSPAQARGLQGRRTGPQTPREIGASRFRPAGGA